MKLGIHKMLFEIAKFQASFQAKLLTNYETDLQHQMRKVATQESISYVKEKMLDALCFDNDNRTNLFDYVLPKINKTGSILEFGVHKGESITNISKRVNERKCHGFDSFEGLPEDWTGQFHPKSHFSLKGELPKVPPNVTLHKGWFKDTIPEFLKENDEKISFLHVDCDLYSSTKDVFDLLGNRIIAGTIIIFDEYFNYPNWQQHEFKAFKEFIEEFKITYQYLAYTNRQEVCMKIIDIKS